MSPKVWEIVFRKYGSRGFSRFIEHAVIKELELGGEINRTEAKNLEAYEKIGDIAQKVRERARAKMAIIRFCPFILCSRRDKMLRGQEQIRSLKPSPGHRGRIKTILGQFRNTHARLFQKTIVSDLF
jgi:hypothetical protein